jgi:DNA-binding IclR family transcriptional regulator
VKELETIRATGVAVDREEYTVGLTGVGRIVRDPYGPVAAISVPVPTPRFYGNEEQITRALIRICDECSASLGV